MWVAKATHFRIIRCGERIERNVTEEKKSFQGITPVACFRPSPSVVASPSRPGSLNHVGLVLVHRALQ